MTDFEYDVFSVTASGVITSTQKKLIDGRELFRINVKSSYEKAWMFWNVSLWGKNAVDHTELKTGTKIFFTGPVIPKGYIKKDGNWGTAYDVVNPQVITISQTTTTAEAVTAPVSPKVATLPQAAKQQKVYNYDFSSMPEPYSEEEPSDTFGDDIFFS